METHAIAPSASKRDGADPWPSVCAIAETQAGAVSRIQLTELGVTRSSVDHWAAKRRIVRVAPRVYKVGGSVTTWEQQLHIGLLCLGDDACVSHEAAAQLHRFDRTPLDAVEFTVPRSRRTTRLAMRVHSTNTLGLVDRCRVDGIPATSATRTIIDLARARVGRRRLEAAVDSAVRSGASAPEVLRRRLTVLRGPGRWGCRLLDVLLVDAGGETMLERRFLTLMRLSGLPRPSLQVPFRDGLRTAARVDFLFEPYELVVEVTGRKGHSSPAERARDAQRRNELQDVGVDVYEFTWEDVTQHGSLVVRTVRRRLWNAGWRPGSG